MKKIISAVSAAAMVFSSAAAVNISDGKAEAADEMIKIMCIGDSITDGYTNDYVGSYRKFIYHNLTEKGYSIDMVGSKSSGGWTPEYTDSATGESFSFDNDYTGYSGYSIQNYSGRSGIYEVLQETGCLQSTAPDIVTLQIGTNDMIDNHEMDTAVDRLEVVVDYILDNIPADSTLFLSTIPNVDPNRSDVYSWFGNYRHSADWQTQYSDEEAEAAVVQTIADYNADIAALAEKKQAQGRNVYLSEAPGAITDVKNQLFDGVHPNNIGYKAMGDSWTAIIEEYLNGSAPIEPPVTTVSEPVTTTTTTTSATTTTASAAAPTTEVTTTTSAPVIDDRIEISDMVKLARYLNGLSVEGCLPDSGKCDMNKDGRLDAYDLVLMRRKLTNIAEKLIEINGDGYKLPSTESDNIVINSPEDLEEKKVLVSSGIAASQTQMGGGAVEPGGIDWTEGGIIS
ncbi:MAG: GDSL-type esterase/lipase family protein [Alistipes sp.]|nr:GDSL-type esterase/lipase family protein [Alistipes sp.]